MPELKVIPVEKIRVPDVRVGSVLSDEQRALIASTIKSVGLVQDPVVRALPDGDYELVSGKSRIAELAAQGHQEVQVKVIEADDPTALIMNITENVARGSYDYISVSKSIRRLKELGVGPDRLEGIFPWKSRWIEFLEGLQDLPSDVVEAISARKLTPTHVQVALELPTPYEIHDGLRTALNLGWDTGTFKTYVQNRVDQVAKARADAASRGQEPIIPPAMPEELIQYTQCLLCGYKKPRTQVTVSQVCDSCKDVAAYVAANLGSDADALQTLYSALQAYFGPPRPQQPQPQPPKAEPSPT